MLKMKFNLIAIFSVLATCLIFVIGQPAKATTISETRFETISELVLYDHSTNSLYEFSSIEAKEAFLGQTAQNQTRYYNPYQQRRFVNRRYTKVGTSHYLVNNVYGGLYGATINIGHSIGTAVEGVNVGLNYGASFSVPARRYGNIVLRTRFSCTEYTLQTRYQGGRWVNTGTYIEKKPISTWYAPVYW